MANFLAQLYESSSLIPIPRVIAELEKETDPKRLTDFAAMLEAAKKIDGKNAERKTYWETLAIWSAKRLGELIAEGKKAGKIATKGQPKKGKKEIAHDGPLLLKDLGIERHQAQRAQEIAAIPAPAVMAYIEAQKESGKDITKSGLVNAAKPKKPKKKKATPNVALATPDVASPKLAEDDEAGGYEPHEAKPYLDKMKKAVAAFSKAFGTANRILGKPPALQAVYKHLEAASVGLEQFRKSFKKKAG